MINSIIHNELIILLTIVLLGYLIGRIKFFGISLGPSACLFVAIAAGILGFKTHQIITNLGIIFFVYSIGIQAGPQFLKLFKSKGIKYSILGLFTVLFGTAVTIGFASLLHLDTAAAVGVFAGSFTSTPALASAIDAIKNYLPGDSGSASLGYAIAYPFGLIGQIFLVQLAPKFFSKQIQEEKKLDDIEKTQQGLTTKTYILKNNNLAGKTIEELQLHSLCKVNVSRFIRNGKTHLCLPNIKLEFNDIVVAVGTDEELHKFKLLFGEEADSYIPLKGDIKVRNIFVSGSEITGKSLKKLKLRETYGINVTRIYRGDIAIPPTGNMSLEIGDSIRIIGTKENINKFIKIAGSEKRRLDDTNILILAFGMLLGAIIGEIPLVIGKYTFKLGIAGGPLLTALVLSHFGRIGKWSVRLPNATKFFLRDMGLVFFLTGIGTNAGYTLPSIIEKQNILPIVILGALVSTITLITSFLLIYKLLRVPILQSLGAMCGATTSSPSLGTLVKTVDSDSPVLSYAAVYPISIILLTIFGQFFVVISLGILK